uniref:Ribosomal protein S13 n=1 Tax=Nitzschia sp. IriIs04 TaxID=1444690 RepID=A0A0S3QPN5_9STRA|nr:ribosomal protein S13 [Nitzschia sp. IriIs04]BAT70293.1 ribosomal protein S13 [Nitzschia sp. IriIs04]
MLKIIGINLPENKKVLYGLVNIYGIGNSIANKIITDLKIPSNLKIFELKDSKIKQIKEYLINLKLEGDLKSFHKLNIKRLIEINNYKGQRHLKKLPVRGQRTKTNAKTRRELKQKTFKPNKNKFNYDNEKNKNQRKNEKLTKKFKNK